MKNLIIIGARGYGRIVYNLALESIKAGANYIIKGFLDGKKDALDKFVGYPPILSSVEDYVPQKDDVFICALGEVKYKKQYAQMIIDKGGEFINVISPTANIMTNVSFGKGCVVGDGTNICCDTRIGNFVTILGGAIIGHDVEIANWAHLGSFSFMGGFSALGEGACLQTGAKLIPHKTMGKYSLGGVGSIILSNVKDGATVFGVPAKRIEA